MFFAIDREYYSEKAIKSTENDDFAMMCTENLD